MIKNDRFSTVHPVDLMTDEIRHSMKPSQALFRLAAYLINLSIRCVRLTARPIWSRQK